MPREQVLTGEMETVTEKMSSQTSSGKYLEISGTAQGVLDYLAENHIPQANVISYTPGTTTYCLIHK
jgi:hypothetical protein